MDHHHVRIRSLVIGASGYTGAELIRLLLTHPNAEIVGLVADKSAGNTIDSIYPHLSDRGLPTIVTLKEVDFSNVDVAFCCLPHGTTQEVVAAIPEHITVIDLSADFRLHDLDAYATWYDHPHRAPQLQAKAVYGLVEINKHLIRNTRLIANPGCYPTSAILPLYPLLESKLIQTTPIIIDSKSGISGAGRSATQSSLFCEVNESMKPYKIGNHRHIPEIEQALSRAAGEPIEIDFTPQIAPMTRGILSTIHVEAVPGQTAQSLRDHLKQYYSNASFVIVEEGDNLPSTHAVYGSNYCRIAVAKGRTKNRITLVSVIDNLVKGASGQAIQNMNICFGLPETTGLLIPPLYP
ncbi:MAG: N-acetyl-gamma-glutamyl-phosphate reductase [Alphaproteobacteria bacterium]|nr:N-acetyl-gamma-glutamyl-phosphate reductase [Alphaproteobacteria bacterium]